MRHRQVLQIVFDRLLATGRWPPLGDAQRRVAAAGLPIDAIANLPERLGEESGGEAVLTIRALRRLAAAADTLDDFLRSVRLAGSRYRNWDADPILTIDDLVEELSLSPARARRAMTLLESESLVQRQHREDGREEFVVAPDVGHYATVRTCRSYVRKRAAVHCGSRRARPLKSLLGWLDVREPSTRDLIVIAFLAGLAIVAVTAALHGL